jgi:hypothetical protein
VPDAVPPWLTGNGITARERPALARYRGQHHRQVLEQIAIAEGLQTGSLPEHAISLLAGLNRGGHTGKATHAVK